MDQLSLVMAWREAAGGVAGTAAVVPGGGGWGCNSGAGRRAPPPSNFFPSRNSDRWVHMADTQAAEGPGLGHEQRSRIGGRWERRFHPLTGRRSTQQNPRSRSSSRGRRSKSSSAGTTALCSNSEIFRRTLMQVVWPEYRAAAWLWTEEDDPAQQPAADQRTLRNRALPAAGRQLEAPLQNLRHFPDAELPSLLQCKHPKVPVKPSSGQELIHGRIGMGNAGTLVSRPAKYGGSLGDKPLKTYNLL